MITLMRKSRRTLQVGLLVVIAAFVVTSVVVLGSGNPGGTPADSVAVVNGEPIPVERYQRRYQEYLNLYAQMLRERFSPEMVERLGLPRQVVDDLVQEELVVQRAGREGLAVTDAELNAYVHGIPAFQENGRFSLKRYEEVLARVRWAKGDFEEDARRRLTVQKVEGLIRNGIKVAGPELEQAFVERREEVRAAWALVELVPLMADMTPTDAELEAHLKDHGDDFRAPERRRVQYVALTPKSFTRPVPATAVETYYKEHAAEFETPRSVRAAHVLVRVPDSGGGAVEDAARGKIAEIIRRARAGEDFAALAREVSEDPASKANGGDLGFIARGEVVPEFEQAVFALGRGEVTAEPVRTPFGFHAIKVLEIREGGVKPLKEVEAAIREKLQQEAADQAARARAEEVRAALLGAEDFMAAAKKLRLEPVESTIARLDRGPLSPPDPLEEAAFALAVGGVSMPTRTPAGWVVARAVEHKAAGVPPLAEIRERVVTAVKLRKTEAIALERATAIVAAARAGDFVAEARKAGAVVGETPRFSRAKPAERLPGDAMNAALTATTGTVTEPVKTARGYYVLKVLERVPPDLEELAAEREKLEQDVRARKQSRAWEAWLAGARANAKIEIAAQLRPPPSRS